MCKTKKKIENTSADNNSGNSENSDNSESRLVSSILSETNTVLYGATYMHSPSQLNAGTQQLTSTPTIMNNQQFSQMLNSLMMPAPTTDLNSVHIPWAIALANCIRVVDQTVDAVSQTLEKLESVEAKMINFEKELCILRAEISQSR